jgi:pimeloyl-ACP methyl ester carboxylesterase
MTAADEMKAGIPVMIFGMSSGAILGILAAAGGLNIKKLAIYEPPFLHDKNNLEMAEAHRRQLTILINSDDRSGAVRYFLKDMIGVPPIIIFIMKILPVWQKLKALAHTLPYDAEITSRFTSPGKQADNIRIPTLVSGGEKSPKWMHDALKSFAEALPQKELTMLKGQAHDVSVNLLAPMLAAFFKK